MDANIKNQFYADRLNRAKKEYSMLFNLYEKLEDISNDADNTVFINSIIGNVSKLLKECKVKMNLLADFIDGMKFDESVVVNPEDQSLEVTGHRKEDVSFYDDSEDDDE